MKFYPLFNDIAGAIASVDSTMLFNQVVKMPKLENERHEMFANEYIKDLNGSQAAIRSGYSASCSRQQGARLMADANIQDRVAELKLERSERTKIDADYILTRLAEIDQMDVIDILAENGELKPVRDWPKVWRTTLSGMDVSEINTQDGPSGLLKKIKWPDKVKNIELLGNHVNVQAFKQHTEISGGITVEAKGLDDFYNKTGDEE